MTHAETQLWSLIRNRGFDGWKFRRQAPVAGYVADFLCSDLKLVVELDGGVHRLREQADAERDLRLTEAGFTVIRSTNEAFAHNPNILLDAIRRHAANRPLTLLPSGEKVGGGAARMRGLYRRAGG